MATDTAPAVPPGPPDPPQTPTTAATGQAPSKGFLASMVAAVEPARASTFSIDPTTVTDPSAPAGDGVLDRSAPGVSSASYRNADEAAAKDPDGRQHKAQGSIWKAWWLAGAQRWGKGGGTANKRLDMQKAKAQAHQVKETRTLSFNRSAGIPVKNSNGPGGAFKNNTKKSGRNSNGKGPVNSTGNRAHGPGRGGSDGRSGSHGPTGAGGPTASGKHQQTTASNTRTPLEKSRTTGHQDGSHIRNVVDHVKAYKDGVVDGYRDKKTDNAKEHDRLDQAHDKHKPASDTTTPGQKTQPAKDTSNSPLKAVVNGQTITITDDNSPLEDPFMVKPTPIQTQGIDATHITLGHGLLKPNISRGELRTFKQYEGRLEARLDGLARIADATKALAAQARDQATECQKLAEQAKNVKGGEKLVAALTKLADQAHAQAAEADEVHRRATKAHDFAKAVLSNIQTRYAPLYQAVVDSDEVKPAELKFYKDRGIHPTESALAA